MAVEPEIEKDQDGLVIHEYDRTVLVVVPPSDYGEEALRHALPALLDRQVGTLVVSTVDEPNAKGRRADEIELKGTVAGQDMADFAGVLFAGGPGALALGEDSSVQELARQAAAAGKPIAAFGEAVAILARAGVLNGQRASAVPELADVVQRGGGTRSGRRLTISGKIYTAIDESAGLRLAWAYAKAF